MYEIVFLLSFSPLHLTLNHVRASIVTLKIEPKHIIFLIKDFPPLPSL